MRESLYTPEQVAFGLGLSEFGVNQPGPFYYQPRIDSPRSP